MDWLLPQPLCQRHQKCRKRKQKQPSPTQQLYLHHSTTHTPVASHGFLAFFTEEELEADSRRFRCGDTEDVKVSG
jgi:hypothetical protein